MVRRGQYFIITYLICLCYCNYLKDFHGLWIVSIFWRVNCTVSLTLCMFKHLFFCNLLYSLSCRADTFSSKQHSFGQLLLTLRYWSMRYFWQGVLGGHPRPMIVTSGWLLLEHGSQSLILLNNDFNIKQDNILLATIHCKFEVNVIDTQDVNKQIQFFSWAYQDH